MGRAMSEELVELVVQLYEKNWGVRDYGLARAVVAMVLEEAARCAEPQEAHDDPLTAHKIAAAIRALKDKA